MQTKIFDISTTGIDGESKDASIQIAQATGLGGQIWFNFPFEHEPLWLLNEVEISIFLNRISKSIMLKK
jgi:hypothetical protein